MKKLIYILLFFLLGCSPKIAIRTGTITGIRDTIINGHKVLVVDYRNEKGKKDFRILHPVKSLKPGEEFKYIEKK